MKALNIALALVALASSPAAAQDPSVTLPRAPAQVSLSGPRIGMTLLSDGILDALYDDYAIDIGPVISQFGWQFERRFYSGNDGLTAVTEWVLLFGGVDQGVAIPSLSWLVGLRAGNGIEFAVGPNFTPAGAALAVAGGVTLRSGRLNFPLNIAVVPSKSGVRVSFLAGFNARR